ncbi:hypothetical protein FRC06_010734 [Ceratobasidium sp. 370]|nr:hypothetical protein FRC06_010734 [Ceratobasidium sp. 370]
MLHASKYSKNVAFKAELYKSVETSQTMVEQLAKVDDELSGLQKDLDGHRDSSPALERIKYILNRCKNDIIRAIEASHTLHNQRQTLTELMDQSKTNTTDARTVTSDIQRLSGVLSTRVLLVKESLDDIKREVQSIQSAHNPQPTSWWRKVWAWSPSRQGVKAWSKLSGLRIQNTQCNISPRECGSILERVTNARNGCSNISGFEEGLIKTGEKTLAVLDEMDELRAENERLKLSKRLALPAKDFCLLKQQLWAKLRGVRQSQGLQ